MTLVSFLFGSMLGACCMALLNSASYDKGLRMAEGVKSSMKYCNYQTVYEDEGKWLCYTDCDKEVIMTRDNKIGKLHKDWCKPTYVEQKDKYTCPMCGKLVNFYSDQVEGTWRING